jgi:large subunit ribosomal protein L17
MGRRYSASSSSRGRRQGLLRNQLTDLILFGFLVTTETKAKALKSEAERLISKTKFAQSGSASGRKMGLAVRREALAFLTKESAAEKLFEQVVPQFKDRVGGYVRVVKLPSRRGDNAPMARVEFVEEIAEPVREKLPAKRAASSKRKSRASLRPSKGEKNGKKDKSNKSK